MAIYSKWFLLSSLTLLLMAVPYAVDADTYVSGVYTEDELWIAGGSPYVLTDNVYSDGNRLTLAPAWSSV